MGTMSAENNASAMKVALQPKYWLMMQRANDRTYKQSSNTT
jgi:hypothetical protein